MFNDVFVPRWIRIGSLRILDFTPILFRNVFEFLNAPAGSPVAGGGREGPDLCLFFLIHLEFNHLMRVAVMLHNFTVPGSILNWSRSDKPQDHHHGSYDSTRVTNNPCNNGPMAAGGANNRLLPNNRLSSRKIPRSWGLFNDQDRNIGFEIHFWCWLNFQIRGISKAVGSCRSCRSL